MEECKLGIMHSLNWHNLTAQVSLRAAMAVGLIAWMLLLLLLFLPGGEPVPVVWCIALTLSVFPIAALATRYPHGASSSLVVLTVLTVGYAVLANGTTPFAYFFAIPILLAGMAVFPSWVGPLIGVIALAFIYSPWSQTPAPSPGIAPGLFVSMVVILQTFVGTAVRDALDGAWTLHTYAQQLVDEANTHRGEVMRLNKSLSLANALLERHAQELAAARREADVACQLKEQFAIYVSHELRTPLNIILGFLEVIQCYPETYGEMVWSPTLRRDLAEIQHSARHLSDLVDDLLDLARVEALKMPMRREAVDLVPVLHETIDLTQRMLLNHPVMMSLKISAPLPTLWIDRMRIRQVLLNLLANATRFTQIGEICIRAQAGDDEVIVSVSDTGVGIPAEQMDTLFADFQQISGDMSHTTQGKGLGLAIAKRFVQMHGGRIWAESELGRGSTFHFSLPVDGLPISRPKLRNPLAEQLPRNPPKLLVVDRDSAASDYLRRRLEGFLLFDAPNLADALPLVRECHPAAVIWNVGPNEEAAPQVELGCILGEGVPVVRCTLPVGTWRFDGHGFSDWLTKPVTAERLLNTIHRYCPPGGRTLVVDDDRGFIQLIRRIVQARALPVDLQWSFTGDDALVKIAAAKPDLLLLDLALPNRSGYQIAHILRSQLTTVDMPIVAMTGFLPTPGTDLHSYASLTLLQMADFTEEEILDFITQATEKIKPHYGRPLLVPAPQADPNATEV